MKTTKADTDPLPSLLVAGLVSLGGTNPLGLSGICENLHFIVIILVSDHYVFNFSFLEQISKRRGAEAAAKYSFIVSPYCFLT